MRLRPPSGLARHALFHALIALLLVFGQVGAQLHALSHLVPAVAAGAPDEPSLPHTQVCDKCIAYAQLGSALHASAPSLPLGRQAVGASESIPAALLPRPAQSYLARAPPVLV